MLGSLLQDIRYGFRMLLRTPGFSLVCVADDGAGDWREYGDLQRGQRRAAAAAALSRSRAARRPSVIGPTAARV